MTENQAHLTTINSLPVKQQIGLYVILRLPGASDDKFSFLSSEFATKFKIFAHETKKANSEDYGKFIGGILSGLSRNSIIKKISGDRDARWALSDDVKHNFDFYKEKLFEVKIYWS